MRPLHGHVTRAAFEPQAFPSFRSSSCLPPSLGGITRARSPVPEVEPMTLRLPWPFPWFACLLVLGLGLRGTHYLLNPVVWHDEAALINNVLGKDFPEYFGRLYYSEAAPPLFLGLEKAAAVALGSSTYALRLLPFLASCAAFVGLAFLGRRLLPAEAVPWLVLLLGTSDRLLWHTCEAKPYAVDLLLAVGLLATLVGPQHPETATEAQRLAALRRRLLLYTALSPFLIFLSFPACFLLGAVALAWLPEVLRLRRPALFALYGLFGVVLCGSFLSLLLGPVRAQRDETLLDCWQTYFPTWDRPWRRAGCLACPLYRGAPLRRGADWQSPRRRGGGRRRGPVARGQRRVLVFLLLPLAMTGLAWLVRQYPFGATRVMVFAAPAALLLISAGLAGGLRVARPPRPSGPAAAGRAAARAGSAGGRTGSSVPGCGLTPHNRRRLCYGTDRRMSPCLVHSGNTPTISATWAALPAARPAAQLPAIAAANVRLPGRPRGRRGLPRHQLVVTGGAVGGRTAGDACRKFRRWGRGRWWSVSSSRT